MHLFGDAELDQGLRPQAQVGARRLKIAGQDAFELFNLPSMEKRRLLLRFPSSFFSFLPVPTHACPLSQPLFHPSHSLSVAALGCSPRGNDEPNIRQLLSLWATNTIHGSDTARL